MSIHKLYGLILPLFRRRRMALFEELFRPNNDTKILDVGGTETNWGFLKTQPRVTLLNIDLEKSEEKGQFKKIPGDGRHLPFPDRSFDIVYSNSVIEHVGTLEDQRSFAREVQRVGKSYFIQTPNRYFPIEPHFITPFIHFLPRSLQLKAAPFTLWGIMTKAGSEEAKKMVDSIRLINKKEFADLFKEGQISHERFLGFSKSLLAIKSASQN